jgi:hypothetical protein
LAFAITTYEQYLKRAKLQLVLVEEIRLSYGYRFSDCRTPRNSPGVMLR